MLDEMDGGQLAEWLAFDELQEEAEKKSSLASKAEAGLRSYKRRGR
jgi:hypothetical protein